MVKKRFINYSLIFIILLSISFISSELQIGNIGTEGINLIKSSLSSSINYSTINVNNSDYLDGYDSNSFWKTNESQTSLTGSKVGSFNISTNGIIKYDGVYQDIEIREVPFENPLFVNSEAMISGGANGDVAVRNNLVIVDVDHEFNTQNRSIMSLVSNNNLIDNYGQLIYDFNKRIFTWGGLLVSGTEVKGFLNISTLNKGIWLYSNHSLWGDTGTQESINLINTIPEAKSYLAWYGYDRYTNDKNKEIGWLGCHYNSTSGNGVHSHCSLETLDNSTGTPSINTHFAVSYASNQTFADVTFPSAVVRDMRVDDIYSATADNIDLKSDNATRIYPSKQTTLGLSISNTSNTITLTGLGTGAIEFLDDIYLNGKNISGANETFTRTRTLSKSAIGLTYEGALLNIEGNLTGTEGGGYIRALRFLPRQKGTNSTSFIGQLIQPYLDGRFNQTIGTILSIVNIALINGSNLSTEIGIDIGTSTNAGNFSAIRIGSATVPTGKYSIYDVSGLNWTLKSDNQKIIFGTHGEFSFYNDGDDLIFNRENGVGSTVLINNNSNIQTIKVHTQTSGTNNVSGIAFSVNTEVTQTPKSAIVHQRKGSYGQGDIVVLVDKDADSNAVNISDEVVRINNTGINVIGNISADRLKGNGKELTEVMHSNGFDKTYGSGYLGGVCTETTPMYVCTDSSCTGTSLYDICIAWCYVQFSGGQLVSDCDIA